MCTLTKKSKQIMRQAKKRTQQKLKKGQTEYLEFLTECGKNQLDYCNYVKSELDNYLANFWFGACKDPDSDYETDSDDPEKKSLMYSANTMRSF